MTNTKGNPGAANSGAMTRTEPGQVAFCAQYSTTGPNVKKPAHKQYRYLTYSRRSTWTILGPMLSTARALGLGDLVDDLLELGRSWQARGLAA